MASNTPPADDIGLEEKPTSAPAGTKQEPEGPASTAAGAPRRAARAARSPGKVASPAAESVAEPVKRSPARRKRAAAKPPGLAPADTKPIRAKRGGRGKSGRGAKTMSLNLPVSAKGLVGMAATIGVVAAGLTAAISRRRMAKASDQSARKSGGRRKASRGKS